VLVTRNNLDDVLADLIAEPELGFDTETYGVEHNDKLFTIQLSTEKEDYYFNFQDYLDITGESIPVLDRALIKYKLGELVFSDPDKTYFIHNAKFDLRRLAIEGVYVAGGVHCTQMCERFIYNQYMSYSLDACLKRRGRAKDDAVENYIREHKLWDWQTKVGKKTRTKKKYYHKVPFSIMYKYGIIDSREVRLLGKEQRQSLKGERYYETDLKLQKVAYNMEEVGMKVRRKYAQSGYDYEIQKSEECVKELEQVSGRTYRNGPKWLRETFDEFGVKYDVNPKTNNPVFDKAALGKIDHPIAKLIVTARRHEKYAGTYYATYAAHETIHAFIKPFGTDTGRLSYAEPNLQNVPKEAKLGAGVPYQVRGCFEPRKDYCFVMIDYDQQEFRMLLDYAGEHALIRKINDHGEDVHQVTADELGIERDPAKTLNFSLLYGVGEGKLAESLGLPTYMDYDRQGNPIVKSREGRDIKRLYFSKLPNVERLINRIKNTAESRKYIRTWAGRMLHFPHKSMSYKAPNHLIQGGCADIAREAMVEVSTNQLAGLRSRLLLQVHDELLFEVHKSELDIVPSLVNAMENVYIPFNGMRLTCGVDHSWVSWGKRYVEEGIPVL
jgi:DNA polymerase I-like protein with 3'-5' exonuclease and polymerase domains